MLRSWRISERWGPIAPIRRVEPFRDDEPAEREWTRYSPFESRPAARKKETADALPQDWSAAALYNEAGRLRHLDVLELGSRVDIEA